MWPMSLYMGFIRIIVSIGATAVFTAYDNSGIGVGISLLSLLRGRMRLPSLMQCASNCRDDLRSV